MEKGSFSWIMFSFDGRVNRTVYWLYNILILNVVYWGIFLLFSLIGGDNGSIVGYIIASLVVIWSTLAISVKRCHDRGRPGVFVLLALIPLVNIWYLIEVAFLAGTDGPNQYGEKP
jgi:uncharacterized membrane protein YhaH (DUF805 family)